MEQKDSKMKIGIEIVEDKGNYRIKRRNYWTPIKTLSFPQQLGVERIFTDAVIDESMELRFVNDGQIRKYPENVVIVPMGSKKTGYYFGQKERIKALESMKMISNAHVGISLISEMDNYGDNKLKEFENCMEQQLHDRHREMHQLDKYLVKLSVDKGFMRPCIHNLGDQVNGALEDIFLYQDEPDSRDSGYLAKFDEVHFQNKNNEDSKIDDEKEEEKDEAKNSNNEDNKSMERDYPSQREIWCEFVRTRKMEQGSLIMNDNDGKLVTFGNLRPNEQISLIEGDELQKEVQDDIFGKDRIATFVKTGCSFKLDQVYHEKYDKIANDEKLDESEKISKQTELAISSIHKNTLVKSKKIVIVTFAMYGRNLKSMIKSGADPTKCVDIHLLSDDGEKVTIEAGVNEEYLKYFRAREIDEDRIIAEEERKIKENEKKRLKLDAEIKKIEREYEGKEMSVEILRKLDGKRRAAFYANEMNDSKYQRIDCILDAKKDRMNGYGTTSIYEVEIEYVGQDEKPNKEKISKIETAETMIKGDVMNVFAISVGKHKSTFIRNVDKLDNVFHDITNINNAGTFDTSKCIAFRARGYKENYGKEGMERLKEKADNIRLSQKDRGRGPRISPNIDGRDIREVMTDRKAGDLLLLGCSNCNNHIIKLRGRRTYAVINKYANIIMIASADADIDVDEWKNDLMRRLNIGIKWLSVTVSDPNKRERFARFIEGIKDPARIEMDVTMNLMICQSDLIERHQMLTRRLVHYVSDEIRADNTLDEFLSDIHCTDIDTDCEDNEYDLEEYEFDGKYQLPQTFSNGYPYQIPVFPSHPAMVDMIHGENRNLAQELSVVGVVGNYYFPFNDDDDGYKDYHEQQRLNYYNNIKIENYQENEEEDIDMMEDKVNPESDNLREEKKENDKDQDGKSGWNGWDNNKLLNEQFDSNNIMGLDNLRMNKNENKNKLVKIGNNNNVSITTWNLFDTVVVKDNLDNEEFKTNMNSTTDHLGALMLNDNNNDADNHGLVCDDIEDKLKNLVISKGAKGTEIIMDNKNMKRKIARKEKKMIEENKRKAIFKSMEEKREIKRRRKEELRQKKDEEDKNGNRSNKLVINGGKVGNRVSGKKRRLSGSDNDCDKRQRIDDKDQRNEPRVKTIIVKTDKSYKDMPDNENSE